MFSSGHDLFLSNCTVIIFFHPIFLLPFQCTAGVDRDMNVVVVGITVDSDYGVISFKILSGEGSAFFQKIFHRHFRPVGRRVADDVLVVFPV